MTYAPRIAPRLYELAALAEKRLAAGHPALEVVLDALVSATATDRGLPPCFDNLTPQMREVVLVLYAGGRTKLGAIAKAMGQNITAVQSVVKRLTAYQVIRRCGSGLYEMNDKTPTLDGMRCVGDRRRVLKYIERIGETTTSKAAKDLHRHPTTMSQALRALFLAGMVDNPRRGVYAAKRTATTTKAA